MQIMLHTEIENKNPNIIKVNNEINHAVKHFVKWT